MHGFPAEEVDAGTICESCNATRMGIESIAVRFAVINVGAPCDEHSEHNEAISSSDIACWTPRATNNFLPIFRSAARHNC